MTTFPLFFHMNGLPGNIRNVTTHSVFLRLFRNDSLSFCALLHWFPSQQPCVICYFFFFFQMFFCISLGFVIAWAPYAVVSFLFIFHKEDWYMAPEGFVFPAIFAKSSHIYNPFIYFYFNKTFQQELRCLLFSFWPKFGGNRVGVHTATVHQAPYPIHIQLQERDRAQRRNFGLSKDRTFSKSKSKGKVTHISGSRVRDRPVYTCWGSTSKNAPSLLVNKPAKDSLPVSI